MTVPEPVEADWNVVATLSEDTYREARRLLRRWGRVWRTGFYNVLALRVADPNAFLHDFASAVDESPGLLNAVSHVVPAQQTFNFRTREEFEARARDILLAWLPRLAGASFHIRLHRRGQETVLSPHLEERLLSDMVLDALTAAGSPGHINFDDPDEVIQIETIDTRAGVSLWSREDRRRYPFLGTD